jgi:ribosomal protein S11
MKQRKKKGKYKNKNKNKIQELVVNKKKVLQKKAHIFFKYGIGHVLFFQKYSNVFLVLKTEKKKHVITLTGGSCKMGNTKKQKISPFNINIMIKRLKEYCNLYNVYRIKFFLRSSINKHYYNIIKYLSLYNIKIMEIGYVLHLPHNGMRGRKLRRI